MNHAPCWAWMITESFNDPARTTGISATRTKGTSYEMIWFTAPIAERSASLLFDPPPPIKSPPIPSDETRHRLSVPQTENELHRAWAVVRSEQIEARRRRDPRAYAVVREDR